MRKRNAGSAMVLLSISLTRWTGSSVIFFVMRSVPSGWTMSPTGSFFPIFCASAQSLGSVTTKDAPPVT